MKPGITLIEVAITIFLASMLASVLFISFSQLQLAGRITESFIEIDMRSAVMIRQMSRDISGAFVPQLALIETSTGKQAPSFADTQKVVMPLDMSTVFKVQNKDKNLDMITCITNNPITIYDTIKPRVARVVYRLIADKEREGTFRLVRQESNHLSLKAFEKTGVDAVRAYQLAHNIKSCTASSIFLEYPEPTSDQQKQKQETKEVAPIMHTLTDWVYDPQKAKEQKMPPLPFAITLQCVFWDDQHRREWPVEFSIPIASFEPYREKKKELPQKQLEIPPGKSDIKSQTEKVTSSTHVQVTVQLQVPEKLAKFLAKPKGSASS